MNLISKLTEKENQYQKNTLNLIASDNYPSPKAMQLVGSIWMDKYAEGYPGKRYYGGQVNTDELETYVQHLALKTFDKTGEYGVNVQVLSGSPANAIVFLGFLNYGDTVMSMNLANGGHLSHLHSTSSYLKFFKLVNYDLKQVEDSTYEVDLDDFRQKLEQTKPKLVIIGFSAYPRQYKFAEMCELAHEHGALVLADIAHINGLVAVGLHDSPFKSGPSGADFVSMTTHKTLRGPRGAMLFAKNDYIDEINKTVFPRTSGGPHMHQIAGVGQSLLEILGEDTYPDNVDFHTYAQNILNNCNSLEKGLAEGGLQIISPTQNHLCLVKLPDSIDSLDFQKKLESLGIIANRNQIPFDEKKAYRPSGMRLGTAALTSRGLNSEQAYAIGKKIAQIAHSQASDKDVQDFVSEVVSSLNWWY